MRLFLRAFGFLVLLTMWGQASDRVALVLENTDYGAQSLAATQAPRWAEKLKAWGFAVEFKRNLASKEIESELSSFLKLTPTNGTAVIVFSGHGVSRVGGQQQKRWVALQGVGEVKDERSAE